MAAQRVGTTPQVSVLITAYKRKEFLLSAARSAAAQTLSRDRYEIVVIKAFEDEIIDRELLSLGCRLVRDDHESIGEMMRVGFLACRGEVVSVLDDDDEFAEGKLAAVQEAFSSDPGLGYLHNGISLIDEQGRTAGPANPGPGDRAFDMSRDWGFCTSAISVRRAALAPVLAHWPEVTKGEDSFLDFVTRALEVHRRQILDPLTRYRVHGSMSSPRTNFAQAYLATARVIRTLPRSSRRDAAMASLLGKYFSAAVRGRSSDRGSALWALLQLAGTRRPDCVREDAREVLCGGLLVVSPGLSLRVYRSLCRGQVEGLPS